MRALAIVLLLGVFVRHDTANWLADESRFSAAAWFYMLGGAWEVMLCGLLLWAVMGYPSSLWRNLAAAALMIGISEGAQIAGCRLAVDNIVAIPPGINMCDYVVGMPVGAVMTSLYLLLICWQIGRAFRDRPARHS